MNKHTVVVFTRNNARVIKVLNADISYYRKLKNCLIDPDLSRVRGVPPHFWKKMVFKNAVRPMTAVEKLEVIASHRLHGVDNSIQFKTRRGLIPRWYNGFALLSVLFGGLWLWDEPLARKILWPMFEMLIPFISTLREQVGNWLLKI